jgi:hypothetical protein
MFFVFEFQEYRGICPCFQGVFGQTLSPAPVNMAPFFTKVSSRVLDIGFVRPSIEGAEKLSDLLQMSSFNSPTRIWKIRSLQMFSSSVGVWLKRPNVWPAIRCDARR